MKQKKFNEDDVIACDNEPFGKLYYKCICTNHYLAVFAPCNSKGNKVKMKRDIFVVDRDMDFARENGFEFEIE